MPGRKRAPLKNTPIPTSQVLSHDRPFMIRDPVHGYLVVAVHERQLIDHPVTQRLRRITQTGLAEYVFPEARTSRFVHSLGAMHIASRFVLAALENAEEDVAVRFFEDIDKYVSKYSGERDAFEDLLRQEDTLSALATVRSSFRHPKLRDSRTKQLMAITEAGLRLAALFHDLGHLPLSHDTEYALQDYAAQQQAKKTPVPIGLAAIAADAAPHEQIGHKLADLAFAALSANTSAAVRAAFDMAIRILNTENPTYDLRKRPQASPLQWLHSLVDGEIDADRADYLLRDGQALGLDFAHYDIERLVNNLVLIDDPDLGFVTAVREPGLAALESYCLSRSRSTQVFIRHHKVAQSAAALRFCSVKAFDTSEAKPFLELLTELGGGSGRAPQDLLDEFAVFDDSWWIQVLRKLQQNEKEPLAISALGVVLDRKRGLRSVWKRKGDLSKPQREDINAKVNTLFSSDSGQILLTNKRRQLLESGILMNAFKFKPYLRRQPTGDSVMLIKGKTRTEPASAVSPLIRHLWDIWDEDIHLYAFVRTEDTATIDDVVKLILA